MTPVDGMDDKGNPVNIPAIEVSNHCAEGALTDPVGLSLQVLITSLAFACLIVKRFCESTLERRTWKIWFYDTSKQAMGASTMHLSNVFLASQYPGNPCAWYIMNFLLDSSIGLTIIIVGIRYAQHLAVRKHWLFLNFGDYGNPARTKVWLIQCGLYLCLISFVKGIVALLMLLPFWDDVQLLIHSMISNVLLEIILDVVIIPFFVNAFIFWVTDAFLMKHKHASAVSLTATPRHGTVV